MVIFLMNLVFNLENERMCEIMILYMTAKTNIPEMTIDFIEVREKTDEIIPLNWDESESGVENSIFTGRYKGVYFGEEYANGRIKELKDAQVEHVEIYSELEQNGYFELTKLSVIDGLDELTLIPNKTDKSIRFYSIPVNNHPKGE